MNDTKLDNKDKDSLHKAISTASNLSKIINKFRTSKLYKRLEAAKSRDSYPKHKDDRSGMFGNIATYDTGGWINYYTKQK